MPYSAVDMAKLVDQAKKSGNEGLAMALFNGATGMGGGMDPSFGGGAVDVELRNLWGNDTAKNWIGTAGNKYGNAMFDPTTGKYGYYENGAIQSGSLEGYDPSNFSKAGYGNYTTSLPATPLYGTGVGLQGDNKTPMSAPAIDKNTLPPGLTGAPPSLANGGIKPNQPGTDTHPTFPGGTPDPNFGPTQPGGPTHPTIPSAPGYTGPGGGDTAPVEGGTGPGDPWPGGPPGGPGGPAPGTPGYTAPTRPDNLTTPFDFLNEEGLQFRLKEGMDQLENSAAARGGLQSGATLKDLERFRQGVSSEEYDKAYGRYDANRKFGEEQFQTDRNFGRNVFADDRNFNRKTMENDRDFQEDARRYGQDFAEKKYVDQRNFDRSVLTGDRSYQTDLERYNSEEEYRRAINDRDYKYKAGVDDRTFNSQTLTNLAQMGLEATKGDAAAQQAFIDAMTKAIMTGGLAEAQGGMGMSQQIIDLINSTLGAKKTTTTTP